jgi:hypothetical protein
MKIKFYVTNNLLKHLKELIFPGIFTLMCILLFSSATMQQAEQMPDTLDQIPPSQFLPAIVGDTIPEEEIEILDEMLTDEIFIRGEYTTQQIRRGERLFNGLVPFRSGQHDCVSCHYTQPQEYINWNPSAHELARVWARDSDYDLISIMNSPVSERLIKDHAGMAITPDERHQLEAYFSRLAASTPPPLRAEPNRALLFWGAGILMLLAIVDLLFTRIIRFKALHFVILLVGIAIHSQIAVIEAQSLGRTPGYAPDQPIKFSHQIHSQENNIDCRYCHHIADFSKSAGIPSNNVCMNCHNVVRNGTFSGRFEINKIHYAAESGQPVEWVRIHKLPDHSVFNHSQHVNAGQLDCSQCHGQVETMHIVRQVEDLSMGWCLSCHRDTDVNFTDNPYYEIYQNLHDKIRNGEIEGVTAARLGGDDCMTCHH